jgi:hypothetical protein
MAVNRVKQKQQKRSRGRPPKARLGDVTSIVEAIHFEEDKMDLEVVNKLNAYYKTLREIAEAKGKFSEVGIKDQVKAIEYCIQRAETFLDDYYSEGKEEEASKEGEETEVKVKETFAPLISLVAEG